MLKLLLNLRSKLDAEISCSRIIAGDILFRLLETFSVNVQCCSSESEFQDKDCICWAHIEGSDACCLGKAYTAVRLEENA